MVAIARIDGSAGSTADARGMFRQVVAGWDRRDWRQSGALLGGIALIHVVGFVVLLGFVAPHQYRLGSQVFGVGLGVTAYTLRLRHAFDADRIAAIDNTTRKLMADGQRPKSVVAVVIVLPALGYLLRLNRIGGGADPVHVHTYLRNIPPRVCVK